MMVPNGYRVAMTTLPDSGIVIALIGAAGTILAAIIPKLLDQRSARNSRPRRRSDQKR